MITGYIIVLTLSDRSSGCKARAFLTQQVYRENVNKPIELFLMFEIF